MKRERLRQVANLAVNDSYQTHRHDALPGSRLQPKRRRPFCRSSVGRRGSFIDVVASFPTTNSRNCACCPTERALVVSQQRRRNRIGIALCCGSHRRGPGLQQRSIGRGAHRRSLKAVLSTSRLSSKERTGARHCPTQARAVKRGSRLPGVCRRRWRFASLASSLATAGSRNCACCPTEPAPGVLRKRRRNRTGTARCCETRRRRRRFQERPIGRGVHPRSL
jgi:hypothetical protein